jgi:hypothetical protein
MLARAGAGQLAVRPVAPRTQRGKLAPIASQRYLLQLTIGQETHDLLRYAQHLLAHQIPSQDLADVLHHTLTLGVAALEKRKFAATSRPPARGRPTTSARHVPAAVKRAVWRRDGGQCL